LESFSRHLGRWGPINPEWTDTGDHIGSRGGQGARPVRLVGFGIMIASHPAAMLTTIISELLRN